MTKPRTLEEITYDAWVAVHTPGNLSREVIFAALREAADAARREERQVFREWADKAASWGEYYREIVVDDLFEWLDARSRAEEPK